MRRKPEYYSLGGTEGGITASRLRRANRSVQRKAMETWFYHKFESPETLPYDSAEGGYQWIWGGPYDPRHELEGEFGGTVPDKVIEELSNELEDISSEWSGNPDRVIPDDDYLYTFTPGELTIRDTFHMNIHNIELLLALKTSDDDLKKHLHRLCFANVITAFETYLADTFIAAVKNKPPLLERFVETNPDFKKQSISLSELFKQSRNIDTKVGAYLSGLVWHNLRTVMPMYETTLDVAFPKKLDSVHKAIRDRHDIVHRNGKSTEGKEGTWEEKEVRELMKAVAQVVHEIEDQISKPKSASGLDRPFGETEI